MNLTGFKALVSTEVNKGTTYDTHIGQRIVMAGQQIERNYSLRYMERYVTFTLSAAGSDPDCVPFPARLKSIKFMRYLDSDGEYVYIRKIEPTQQQEKPTEPPTGYWLDGIDFIWLNSKVGQDLEIELSYIEYSDWNNMGLTDQHWLFDNASDLLLAHCMILLSPACREPDWKTEYEDMRSRGERTLFLADAEAKQSNSDDIMIYS